MIRDLFPLIVALLWCVPSSLALSANEERQLLVRYNSTDDSSSRCVSPPGLVFFRVLDDPASNWIGTVVYQCVDWPMNPVPATLLSAQRQSILFWRSRLRQSTKWYG